MKCIGILGLMKHRVHFGSDFPKMSEVSSGSCIVAVQQTATPCVAAALCPGDVLGCALYARFDGHEENGDVRLQLCATGERIVVPPSDISRWTQNLCIFVIL